VCKRPEACFGAPASATGRGASRFRGVSHRQPVVSATIFHPRGVFRDVGCFVRRGVTSSRHAHSAGVKRPVGAFRADGDGVKRSGGVLCTDGVRGFTYQPGVTLLTSRGVPLSTPPSSAKHTRNRRVMLRERFLRDYRRICARIVHLSAVNLSLWRSLAIRILWSYAPSPPYDGHGTLHLPVRPAHRSSPSAVSLSLFASLSPHGLSSATVAQGVNNKCWCFAPMDGSAGDHT
jgi:hypothetical protein